MNAPAPSSSFTGGVQFAWDSTSLQNAQDCLWKYWATNIEGWRSRGSTPHLLFGGWYATALEHFHKHIAEGQDRDVALRSVVLEALTATWIDGRPWDSGHHLKTRENLIRTIVWYVDHFDPDPLEVVHLANGRPAVEYSFSFEIADDILWCGHLDRIVEYSGDTYVQDQKTTGYTLTNRYFDDFNPDVQMTGYTYAAQIIWPGPIKGVIIDAAQIAVGFSRFERGFTFRTPAQLSEWRLDSLYHIRTAQLATQQQYFPRNRSSCNKFGGCVFRTVCSRSPEVRQNFLEADFERRAPWNPLAKR